jgi:hypothetical protein
MPGRSTQEDEMSRSFLAVSLIALALAVPGLVASAAAAAGPPIAGVGAGPEGVTAQAGDFRYVTLPAGRNTVLARVNTNGGEVARSRFLRGSFMIPAVANDGSASGLSADGETLVLIRPRAGFPAARTRFAIVDSRGLRPRDLVTLRGDYGFDAIAPDGSKLYFTEYVSPRDPTRYVVRAYDVRTGRTGSAIVDKREPDEKMRGYPITRANSPDGRWAYTLYDGAGKHPFVHALDTRDGRAFCIDLDALSGRSDLFDLRLAIQEGGDRLSVVAQSEPLALIDTRSFRVNAPRAAAPSNPDQEVPATLIALAAGGLVLAVGVPLAVRRRRRLAAT